MQSWVSFSQVVKSVVKRNGGGFCDETMKNDEVIFMNLCIFAVSFFTIYLKIEKGKQKITYGVVGHLGGGGGD